MWEGRGVSTLWSKWSFTHPSAGGQQCRQELTTAHAARRPGTTSPKARPPTLQRPPEAPCCPASAAHVSLVVARRLPHDRVHLVLEAPAAVVRDGRPRVLHARGLAAQPAERLVGGGGGGKVCGSVQVEHGPAHSRNPATTNAGSDQQERAALCAGESRQNKHALAVIGSALTCRHWQTTRLPGDVERAGGRRGGHWRPAAKQCVARGVADTQSSCFQPIAPTTHIPTAGRSGASATGGPPHIRRSSRPACRSAGRAWCWPPASCASRCHQISSPATAPTSEGVRVGARRSVTVYRLAQAPVPRPRAQLAAAAEPAATRGRRCPPCRCRGSAARCGT